MIFPPNVDVKQVPQEYRDLCGAIKQINNHIEQLLQDKCDIGDYDLPDAMYSRLQTAIDARVRELIAEKTRYSLRQIGIEREVLGDIPD